MVRFRGPFAPGGPVVSLSRHTVPSMPVGSVEVLAVIDNLLAEASYICTRTGFGGRALRPRVRIHRHAGPGLIPCPKKAPPVAPQVPPTHSVVPSGWLVQSHVSSRGSVASGTEGAVGLRKPADGTG